MTATTSGCVSTGSRGTATDCDAVQFRDQQRRKVNSSSRGSQQAGYGNGNGKEHRRDSNRRNVGGGGNKASRRSKKSSGLKMNSKSSSPLKKHPSTGSGAGLDARLDPKSLLGISGDLSCVSSATTPSDPSGHLRDVCMAHVITSLADRTIGNPALMLQRLLDFSPSDYDDLLLALAESGCSYVDILAAYIHNLRVVAADQANQRGGGSNDSLAGGITQKFNDLLSEITKASAATNLSASQQLQKHRQQQQPQQDHRQQQQPQQEHRQQQQQQQDHRQQQQQQDHRQQRQQDHRQQQQQQDHYHQQQQQQQQQDHRQQQQQQDQRQQPQGQQRRGNQSQPRARNSNFQVQGPRNSIPDRKHGAAGTLGQGPSAPTVQRPRTPAAFAEAPTSTTPPPAAASNGATTPTVKTPQSTQPLQQQRQHSSELHHQQAQHYPGDLQQQQQPQQQYSDELRHQQQQYASELLLLQQQQNRYSGELQQQQQQQQQYSGERPLLQQQRKYPGELQQAQPQYLGELPQQYSGEVQRQYSGEQQQQQQQQYSGDILSPASSAPSPSAPHTPPPHLMYLTSLASSSAAMMHDMHAGLLLPGVADRFGNLGTPTPPSHQPPKLRSYWSENLEDARSYGRSDLSSLMQSPHRLPSSREFGSSAVPPGMSPYPRTTPLSQNPVPEDFPAPSPASVDEFHPGSATAQYMAELQAAAMHLLPPMQPQQPQVVLLPNGIPITLAPGHSGAGGGEMTVLQLSEDMYGTAGLDLSHMSSMLSVGSSHAVQLPSFHSEPLTWSSIWQ